jgi:hypothetical protein
MLFQYQLKEVKCCKSSRTMLEVCKLETLHEIELNDIAESNKLAGKHMITLHSKTRPFLTMACYAGCAFGDGT